MTKRKAGGGEPSPARPSLNEQVKRFGDHLQSKRSLVDSLPETLSNLPLSTEPEIAPRKHHHSMASKSRKLVTPKPEDDELTRQSCRLANAALSANCNTFELPVHTSAREAELAKTKKRQISDVEKRSHKKQKFSLATVIQPLSQLPSDNKAVVAAVNAAAATPQQTTVEFLSGREFVVERLRRMFELSEQHWTRAATEKLSGAAVEAEQKEVVSRSHVAQMLWCASAEQRSWLPPCPLAEHRLCRAQMDPMLRHELAPPDTAAVAYQSARRFAALLQREEAVAPEYRELCEFCYRYFIETEVERCKADNHRVEKELPSRYYIADVFGEYSREGMHQPSYSNGIQHPNGILGHMRRYNVSDFTPVVAALEPDGRVNTNDRCWTVHEYRTGRESGRIPATLPVVYGWREVRGLFQLNEKAFLEAEQINPYETTVFAPLREPTLDNLLQGFFEKRTLNRLSLAHIFWDLWRCVCDADYLRRDNLCPDAEPPLERWRFWCLHEGDALPPESTHKIYRCLLVRVNTVHRLLAAHRHQLVEPVPSRLQVFLQQHESLCLWMQASRTALSDAELRRSTVLDLQLRKYVSPLFANYPFPRRELSVADCESMELARWTLTRENPLDTVKRCFSASSPPPAFELVLPHSFDSVKRTVGTSAGFSVLQTTATRCYEANAALLQASPPLDTSSEARIQAGFRQQELLVERYRTLYHALLGNKQLLALVLCSFDETVERVRALPAAGLLSLLRYCQQFESLLPTQWLARLRALEWTQHRMLFAALLRVHVFEQLHELTSEARLRLALALLRNSHLRLVRWIFEDDSITLSDAAIEAAQWRRLWTAPAPEREVHEGLLPNFVNALANVNFFSDGGLDDQPWIKMQFKKPDRCCDGREYCAILRDLCSRNEAFRRLTALELELSLKGLYEHCRVRPSFRRSLVLDELFETATDDLDALIQQLDNVVVDATSESLCYMLQFSPALRDTLRRVYRDWFAWRVIVNMDIARQCFEVEGSFARAYQLIYKRVRLQSNKVIFRFVEFSFPVWLCKQVKQWDKQRLEEEGRELSERLLAPESALSDDDKDRIYCFVATLSPLESLNVAELPAVGLSTQSIERLCNLYLVYCRLRGENGSGKALDCRGNRLQNAAHYLSSFRDSPKQYNLLCFFFTLLQRYQNVRTMRITNLELLQAQGAALRQRYAELSGPNGELPSGALNAVIGVCCGYVKNTFPTWAESFAGGTEKVYSRLDRANHTCATPKQRAGSAQKRAVTSSRINRKTLLRREQEAKRPLCAETEVLEVNLLGEMLLMDSMKTHGAKRVKLQSSQRAAEASKHAAKAAAASANSKKKKNPNGAKSHSVAPPNAPFWHTPCCGALFGYRYEGWFPPNNYACGLCSRNRQAAEQFESFFCVSCRCALTTRSKYNLVRTFDDVFSWRMVDAVLCDYCLRPWSQARPQDNLLSQIIALIRNPPQEEDKIKK
jgi:hypothetical protein